MSHKIMKTPELVGKRYGKLTVVSLKGGSRNGSKLWDCICDCGNKAIVTTRHLNRKHNVAKSCGCLLNRSKSDHHSWKGYEGISGHWWKQHVERSAYKRANIEVTITMEYAWDLFIKLNRCCALSGLPIVISDDYTSTASIDRIDSSLGYIEDNIQWVHKDVNYMKRNYSMEYFIKMCSLITEHNK